MENNKIKKNKKYRPPNHWDEDLQRIKVGSKYFMDFNVVNPVPVKPEIDSKNEFKKDTWELLK